MITARYTDHGHRTIKPITRQATTVLRSPVFQGQDFDKGLELHRGAILEGINRASYAMARQVDMIGVRTLEFKFVTETPETIVRLRVDSPRVRRWAR